LIAAAIALAASGESPAIVAGGDVPDPHRRGNRQYLFGPLVPDRGRRDELCRGGHLPARDERPRHHAYLVEHDLFGKPDMPFPDHAVT